MKQAYLICAHGSFNLLKKIIIQLDDIDNDIYIHIDKKVGDIDYKSFENITKNSTVVCLRNRVNVIWGHISQMLVTIQMLESALKNKKYDYFHLISGVDFPIKSNEYIKKFLCEHKGTEFVGFVPNTDFGYKLGLYHLIPYNLQKKYFLLSLLEKCCLKCQKLLGIRHYKRLNNFGKGCNWWSITSKLAKDIIDNKYLFKKMYRFSLCADEIFLQTYLLQHKGKYKIYNESDEYLGCLRKIDWKRGNPYVWQLKDVEELLSSDALFARKFNEEHSDVVDELIKKLK